MLDPFCGCGTAIAAAQKLGRRWIGIDITHLAIALIKPAPARRLRRERRRDLRGRSASRPPSPTPRRSPRHDPYQFQWWALGPGRRPRPSSRRRAPTRASTAASTSTRATAPTKQIILSVKAGHTQRRPRPRPARRGRPRGGRDRRADQHAGADQADARGGGLRRLLPLAAGASTRGCRSSPSRSCSAARASTARRCGTCRRRSRRRRRRGRAQKRARCLRQRDGGGQGAKCVGVY